MRFNPKAFARVLTANLNDQDRDIIRRCMGFATPLEQGVAKLIDRGLETAARRCIDVFEQARYAEHLTMSVHRFGNTIGIENQSVAYFER
jgi:hypothetical protein